MILKVHEKIYSCEKNSILVTKKNLLSEEMNSRHKKSILVTRNHFLSQEINSCQRNQFLSKESILVTRINSCHKKLFLVRSHPSVELTISSRQRVNPTKKFRLSVKHFVGTWFPGSQRKRRPAALGTEIGKGVNAQGWAEELTRGEGAGGGCLGLSRPISAYISLSPVIPGNIQLFQLS